MQSSIYNNSMIQLADVIIDTFGGSCYHRAAVSPKLESSPSTPIALMGKDFFGLDPIPIGPSKTHHQQQDMSLISLFSNCSPPSSLAKIITTGDSGDCSVLADSKRNTSENNRARKRFSDPSTRIALDDDFFDLDPIPIGPSKTHHQQDMSLISLISNCSSASVAKIVTPDDDLADSKRNARNNNNRATKRFSKHKHYKNGIAVLECRKSDVLLGRGGHACTHPGNLDLLLIVKANRPKYKSLDKTVVGKSRKRVIVQEIVAHMYAKGTRFLYREKKGEDEWREANSRAVYEKVSHMLRDR